MLQPRRALARAALAAACGATLVPIAGALTGASVAGATVVVADDLRGAGAVTIAQQALVALQHGDESAYGVFRPRLAALVAPAAGVDAVRLDAVWAAADHRRMVTVLSALTQLGVPYHYRGDTPGGSFDCSGLTSWAWAQSGVGLPHQSGRQIRDVRPVDLGAVQPGDLLYYPGHVMLALGIGAAMVHAPNTGNVVEVRTLNGHRHLRAGDPLG